MTSNRFAIGQPGEAPRQIVQGSDRFVRDQMLEGEVAHRLAGLSATVERLPATSDL